MDLWNLLSSPVVEGNASMAVNVPGFNVVLWTQVSPAESSIDLGRIERNNPTTFVDRRK